MSRFPTSKPNTPDGGMTDVQLKAACRKAQVATLEESLEGVQSAKVLAPFSEHLRTAERALLDEIALIRERSA